MTASPPPESTGRTSARRAFVVYTALRIGLVLALWWLIQLVTPLRGVLALAVAILVSGLVSLVLLNRPRQAMGEGVAGFFARMNARIDASAAAEDAWDDELRARASAAEQDAQEDAVRADEQAGAREDGDERGAGRA